MSDFTKCNLCNHSTKILCDRPKAITEKILESQYPKKTADSPFTIHHPPTTPAIQFDTDKGVDIRPRAKVKTNIVLS